VASGLPFHNRLVIDPGRQSALGSAGAGFVDRGVDVLAFASQVSIKEGHESAHQGPVAAGLVSLIAVASNRRRAENVVVAAACHRAAHGQAHKVRSQVVSIRTSLTEGSNGGHDEARVKGAEMGVTKAQAIKVARHGALDEDVGLFYQLHKEFFALLGLNIQGDASLADVVVPEVEAAILMWHIIDEGAYHASGVACRRLDLDDVGPQTSQELANVMAFLITVFYNSNVLERARRCVLLCHDPTSS